MGVYIPIIKTSEDEKYVSYFFYMTVLRDKDDMRLPDGKTRKAIGFCTINKNTKECFLDEKRSDHYFIGRSGYFDNVCVKLLKLEKAGKGFPDHAAYEA